MFSVGGLHVGPVNVDTDNVARVLNWGNAVEVGRAGAKRGLALDLFICRKGRVHLSQFHSCGILLLLQHFTPVFRSFDEDIFAHAAR